jgi:hypothetical protein
VSPVCGPPILSSTALTSHKKPSVTKLVGRALADPRELPVVIWLCLGNSSQKQDDFAISNSRP